jgi:Transcriptional regulator
MDINFELYKIFYYTAITGSFTEASKRLYVTQSAVSQAIGNLEEKMGTSLFIRKTRSIKLTHEGEILFKYIDQAYNFIKTAEGKITEIRNLSLGEIRIGVGDTHCRFYLIPYMKKFIELYPHIKFKVINRTSPRIIDSLKNGQLDFGLVTLPVFDDAINISRFRDVRDVFVASNKFAELKGQTISLSGLIRYPLLLLQKDSSTRRNLDKFFSHKGLEIMPEIELESVELLVEFARIGLGIAHVLFESAEKLVESGELFIVDTEEPIDYRTLGIATMKDIPVSLASSEFISLMG